MPSPEDTSVPHAATPERAARLAKELEAVRAKPESTARSIEESKLCYFVGLATTGKDKRRQLFEDGVEAAERARKAEPANPAALAWWAANEANLADATASFSSLRMISRVQDVLKELREKAPGFEQAAADRGLGRLYHKAPSIISVGSRSKAEAAFKRALEKYPDHPGNRIYYAQFLYDRGNCAESRRLAKAVRESQPESKYPYDAPGWLEIAAEILRDTRTECGGGS